MKRPCVLLALFIAASLGSARAQQLLNFDFTITSQSYYSYANYFSYTVPETYTLTGEIIGLQNNATSAPADVLIFNTIFPDGGGLSGFVQNPYSLVAHGFSESGAFTVSNGAITGTSSAGVSYNLLFPNGNEDSWDNFYFNATSQADGMNGAGGITNVNGQNGGSGIPSGGSGNYSIYNGEEAYNTNGLAGVTFTLVATPEPRAWALGLVGLGSIAFLHRRARTHVTRLKNEP